MVAACPFPANRGTPSRILRMAEGMAELGHKIHVVTYHFGEDIQTKGIEIHRIPKITKYHYLEPGPTSTKLFLLDYMLFFKLLTITRKKKIDLIHGHHFEGALIGFGVRALTQTKVIYDAHTTLIDELPYYRLWFQKRMASFLDYHVPQWADFNIAVSDELQENISHKGIPADRITVISSGVNIEAFKRADSSSIRKQYGLKDKSVVMYTGSLADFQDFSYLLRAISLVFKNIEDAVLIVVGNGDVDKYIQLCHHLGIQDKVLFAGSRSFTEIPNYLAAADIAVVSRINCPGIPQKLINYMAAKKAIVSFEGSAKLLTHGINGLVVRNGDIIQMSEAIVKLLKDAELRQKLGENAQNTMLDQYEWNILCKRIETIYAHVMGL
jgi:glycosyltransferase involved in cell wall biosynthesis